MELLSLKESERDLDHLQFKKFAHNGDNDDGEKSADFQFEALNDEPLLNDKRLFSSNDDHQSSDSSSAQLFGRLLRNRDRFAYLYAHLNDFLRRRKRQTSGAASQPSVNLPPSSLPGLGPEKPFQ
uniref:Uncharacterized protein n=1 Tax=Romanomermis culicivorax TaxID=13658 RepID=A0A915JRA0_ROMCU